MKVQNLNRSLKLNNQNLEARNVRVVKWNQRLQQTGAEESEQNESLHQQYNATVKENQCLREKCQGLHAEQRMASAEKERLCNENKAHAETKQSLLRENENVRKQVEELKCEKKRLQQFGCEGKVRAIRDVNSRLEEQARCLASEHRTLMCNRQYLCEQRRTMAQCGQSIVRSTHHLKRQMDCFTHKVAPILKRTRDLNRARFNPHSMREQFQRPI